MNSVKYGRFDLKKQFRENENACTPFTVILAV